MIEELIQMYRDGAISDYQIAVDCLHVIDPDHPELVLKDLPPEIHDTILEYAQRYDRRKTHPGNRILPATDQVNSAAAWIQERRREQSKPASSGLNVG